MACVQALALQRRRDVRQNNEPVVFRLTLSAVATILPNNPF
jgi:hypothetical protein